MSDRVASLLSWVSHPRAWRLRHHGLAVTAATLAVSACDPIWTSYHLEAHQEFAGDDGGYWIPNRGLELEGGPPVALLARDCGKNHCEVARGIEFANDGEIVGRELSKFHLSDDESARGVWPTNGGYLVAVRRRDDHSPIGFADSLVFYDRGEGRGDAVIDIAGAISDYLPRADGVVILVTAEPYARGLPQDDEQELKEATKIHTRHVVRAYDDEWQEQWRHYEPLAVDFESVQERESPTIGGPDCRIVAIDAERFVTGCFRPARDKLDDAESRLEPQIMLREFTDSGDIAWDGGWAHPNLQRLGGLERQADGNLVALFQYFGSEGDVLELREFDAVGELQRSRWLTEFASPGAGHMCTGPTGQIAIAGSGPWLAGLRGTTARVAIYGEGDWSLWDDQFGAGAFVTGLNCRSSGGPLVYGDETFRDPSSGELSQGFWATRFEW